MDACVNWIDFHSGSYIEACLLKTKGHAASPCEQIYCNGSFCSGVGFLTYSCNFN
jgi:hypothetical protein